MSFQTFIFYSWTNIAILYNMNVSFTNMNNHKYNQSISSEFSADENDSITIETDDSDTEDHNQVEANKIFQSIQHQHANDGSSSFNIESTDASNLDCEINEYKKTYGINNRKILPKLQTMTTRNNDHEETNTPVVVQSNETLEFNSNIESSNPIDNFDFGSIEPNQTNEFIANPSYSLQGNPLLDDDEFFTLHNASHQTLSHQKPVITEYVASPSIFQPETGLGDLSTSKFSLQRVLSPGPDVKRKYW